MIATLYIVTISLTFNVKGIDSYVYNIIRIFVSYFYNIESRLPIPYIRIKNKNKDQEIKHTQQNQPIYYENFTKIRKL